MTSEIVEFVGLTREVGALIEHFRRAPGETRGDIIARVLSSHRPPEHVGSDAFLDLGQGAQAHVGEKLFLFLSRDAKRKKRPDAEAEAREDGLYIAGDKVNAPRGTHLHAAMRLIQERKNHRNAKGEIIQLSAFRQWHVVRGGELVPVGEIKVPALTRRRGRLSLTSNKSAEDLGL